MRVVFPAPVVLGEDLEIIVGVSNIGYSTMERQSTDFVNFVKIFVPFVLKKTSS